MKHFNQIIEAVKNQDFSRIKTLKENVDLPTEISPTDLKLLLFEVIYPLMIKQMPEYKPEHYDEISAVHWADALFQQILYDRYFEQRQWIEEDLELALEQGKTLHEFLNRHTKKETQPVSENPNDVLAQIFEALQYPNIIKIPWDEKELAHNLSPYFGWMQHQLKHNPYAHYQISWQVLKYAQKSVKKGFYNWFKKLEEKQQVEQNFSNNIAQALEWESFIDQTDPTAITKKDFEQWLIWLDHENPVLRGIAAKCIGNVYTDWQDEEDEFQGHQHIPLTKMLDILYQKQVEGKNVVGGFIDGITTEVEGLHDLEKHKILREEDFDVKNWILKTAIDSPESEPYIPGSQAFWFYVHEYLDFDVDSVHKLIDGKRYWLAMMCATESLYFGAYHIMQPVLKRLQEEESKAIAEEVKRQEYLYVTQQNKEK